MEKPGIFVYAVPGQRKALIEAARELDRRGFPFLYASHGSAPAIEPEASSERVVRPYEGTAVWQDALTHALESYINLLSTPITEATALGAIRLICCHTHLILLDVATKHYGKVSQDFVKALILQG